MLVCKFRLQPIRGKRTRQFSTFGDSATKGRSGRGTRVRYALLAANAPVAPAPRAWIFPLMQAFRKARRVKRIRTSRRRPAAAIRGPGPRRAFGACKKRSWFTRDRLPLLSLHPCPRRKRLRETVQSKPAGGRAPFSSATPSQCMPLAEPPASEAWSQAPATRRFANRTTDMAPTLRDTTRGRVSPCRSRCSLSASARRRCRAPSSPVRRLPKRSDPGAAPLRVFVLRHPVARDPLVQAPLQRLRRVGAPHLRVS